MWEALGKCSRVERETLADEHGLVFIAIFLLLLSIFFNITVQLIAKYIIASIFYMSYQYDT